MKRKITSMGVAVAIMLVMVVSAGAAPGGTDTIVRWIQTGATTAELRVDGITNGLPAGAVAYDIYMRVPQGFAMPVVTVGSVGPAWTALNCGFTADFYPQPSDPPPPGSGDRGLLLIATCTSSAAQSSVTGDNVLLATIDLAGCPAGGFTMDLDSGDDVYGSPVSDLVDSNINAFFFPDANMIDGPACGAPTAVELTNVQADSASNTAQYGALLALALLVAIVVGAGFALRRRNSAVNS